MNLLDEIKVLEGSKSIEKLVKEHKFKDIELKKKVINNYHSVFMNDIYVSINESRLLKKELPTDNELKEESKHTTNYLLWKNRKISIFYFILVLFSNFLVSYLNILNISSQNFGYVKLLSLILCSLAVLFIIIKGNKNYLIDIDRYFYQLFNSSEIYDIMLDEDVLDSDEKDALTIYKNKIVGIFKTNNKLINEKKKEIILDSKRQELKTTIFDKNRSYELYFSPQDILSIQENYILDIKEGDLVLIDNWSKRSMIINVSDEDVSKITYNLYCERKCNLTLEITKEDLLFLIDDSDRFPFENPPYNFKEQVKDLIN